MKIDRFKSAIKSTKLKDKEIVEKLSLKKETLTSIKMKKQSLSPKIAFLFEYHFDINPLWLMYGLGDMYEAKFDLGGEKKWDDDRDFERILEERLQIRFELLKQNADLSLKAIPDEVKLSDEFILSKLISEVACDEFKKGLIKQLEVMRK